MPRNLNVPVAETTKARNATAVTTAMIAALATVGGVRAVTITSRRMSQAVATVSVASHAVAACTVTAVTKTSMRMIGVPGVIAVRTAVIVSTVITAETSCQMLTVSVKTDTALAAVMRIAATMKVQTMTRLEHTGQRVSAAVCVVAGVRGKISTKGKTMRATKDAVWRCGLRGHHAVMVGKPMKQGKQCVYCGGKMPARHRVLTGASHAVDVVTTTVVGICGGFLSLVALACILHLTGVTL